MMLEYLQCRYYILYLKVFSMNNLKSFLALTLITAGCAQAGSRGHVPSVAEQAQYPLHYAAALDNADTVRSLIKNGTVHVDALNKYGKTALHQACQNGQIVTVKVLVEECGANVNAQTSPKNKTALHKAAKQGYVDVVAYLLTKGADVNARNAKGQTVLDTVEKRLAKVQDGTFLKALREGTKRGLHVYEQSLTDGSYEADLLKTLEVLRANGAKRASEL